MGGDAPGEELRVEAISVPVGPDWTRGPTKREKEDEVFILDRNAGKEDALQILLMRGTPVIKGDAEAYYARLTRYWRAQFGKAVLIGRLEAGGVNWLYLRRPARENGRGVFQLSTVFEGRAYSLLVFVPGTMTVLSAPVMELLAAMRWEPRGNAATVAELPASPTQAAPVRPVSSLPERWVRARARRLNLSGGALEAVASADVDSLGREGMLTGYGLDYGEASVDWFVEGFSWKTVAGRASRVPWATRGRLEVDAPGKLNGESAWTLRLSLPEGEAGVSARLAIWDLCGPQADLKEILDRLDQGARGHMERFAATPRAGCPAPRVVEPAPRLRVEPGATATATWTLPLSGQPEAIPAMPVETVPSRIRLVETILEPGERSAAPGDGLLERARLFFVYESR